MNSNQSYSALKSKTIVFTQEWVDEFCQCVNDRNPIHRADWPEPTVPGMLTTSIIFEDPLYEWTRLAIIEIKFRNVVLVGKETVYEYSTVFFKSRHRKFRVLVKQDNKLCVEAEYLVVKKDQFEEDQR
jgi:acyl dehydratase